MQAHPTPPEHAKRCGGRDINDSMLTGQYYVGFPGAPGVD